MAKIDWRTRKLSGGRVRLFGDIRLSCGHTVTESAQVRDDARSLANGQATIARLLEDAVREHIKECT